MPSIRELVDINIQSAEKLEEIGIRTIEQLIELGTSSTERMRLADISHLDDASIKKWVHQADLMRVEGIQPTLAHLLCQVAVCTAPKLAYRNASRLHAELIAYNAASHTMKSVPDIDELRAYIASAKQLPKLVRH